MHAAATEHVAGLGHLSLPASHMLLQQWQCLGPHLHVHLASHFVLLPAGDGVLTEHVPASQRGADRTRDPAHVPRLHLHLDLHLCCFSRDKP